MNYSKLRQILLLLICLTMLAQTSCQKPPKPKPDDTLPPPIAEDRPDWINTEEVYGPGARGLEMREESFNRTGPAGETGLAARDSSGEGLMGSRDPAAIYESIYFDYDQSSISDQERDKLVKVADYLIQEPSLHILIEGHCDWRGTREYNLALGDRRAKRVEQYLITLGIDPGRLETVSKGDLEAIENADTGQMRQDRRADLIMVK